jgi:hypothetical protein
MDYEWYFDQDLSELHLTFNYPYTGTVSLSDLQGRSIQRRLVDEKKLNIPCQNVVRGIYLLQVGNTKAQRVLLD